MKKQIGESFKTQEDFISNSFKNMENFMRSLISEKINEIYKQNNDTFTDQSGE